MTNIAERCVEFDGTKEAWENITKISLMLAPPNLPTRVEWSDAYFWDHFVSKYRIKKRPLRDEAAACARVFLRFYMGDTPSTKILEIMILILGYMKRGEVPLVHDDIFHDSGVEPVNPGALSSGTPNYETSLHTVSGGYTAQSASNSGVATGSTQTAVGLQVVDAVAWWSQLEKNLSLDPAKEENHVLIDNTLYYIGFIVMQFSRLATKEKEPVALHIFQFTSERFKRFWNVDILVTETPPPSISALNILASTLAKLQATSLHFISICVWSHAKASESHKDIIQSTWKAGGMLSLAYVGLGCLNWFIKASNHLRIEALKLLEYLAIERYNTATRDIIHFIGKIILPGTCLTWEWARLFSDGAYYHLSTKSQPEVAAIFMAITIEGDKRNELWKIPQFTIIQGQTRIYCCKYARAIIEDIRKTTSQTAISKAAKRINERMEKTMFIQDDDDDDDCQDNDDDFVYEM